MRYLTITLSFVWAGLSYSQIGANYQPPVPIALPCHQITATNGINTSLHEHTRCVETHPDASVYPGYEAFVYATNNDVEIKAGEEIYFSGGMHFAATNGNEIWAHIETPDAVNIAWFYPQGSPQVALRHEKMEIGLDLPLLIDNDVSDFLNLNINGSNELNPYNPQDIEITAKFYENGNLVKTVPAFYYREFVRDDLNDGWIEDTTSYNWRIRFAPPIVSENWQMEVTINAHGHSSLSRNMSFKVLESNNPGYLEIGEYKKQLRFNHSKESFFIIGQTLGWPDKPWVYPGESNPNIGYMGRPNSLASFKSYYEDIENLKDNQGNFFRFVGQQSSFQFEGLALGNYDPEQSMAWELDRMLGYCEDFDLYTMYCLISHQGYETKYNDDGVIDINRHGEDWLHNPYNSNRLEYPHIHTYAQENLANISSVVDYLASPDARELVKNYYRYVLSRYGYSTSIGAWQLMSEADVLNGLQDVYEEDASGIPQLTVSNAANRYISYQWHKEMGEYFKHVYQDDHLMSQCLASHQVNGTTIYDGNVMALPEFDFTGMHLYIRLHDVFNNETDNNVRNRNVKLRWQVAERFNKGDNNLFEDHGDKTEFRNKPFIYDEFGVNPDEGGWYVNGFDADGDGVIDISGNMDPIQDFNDCSDIVWHNDLWSSAMMGSMGVGLEWWNYARDNYRQANYPGLVKFFANIDFEYKNYNNDYDNGETERIQRWPKSNSLIEKTNYNTGSGNNKNYKKKDRLEVFTMVASDKSQGFGWMHNRSAYFGNINSPCYDNLRTGVGYPLEWPSNSGNYVSNPTISRPNDDDKVSSITSVSNSDSKFTIYNLHGWHQYTFAFYDTRTGNLISTETLNTTAGGKAKLKNEIPSFNGTRYDIAFKFWDDYWNKSELINNGELEEANNFSVKDMPNNDSLRFKNLYLKAYPNPAKENVSIALYGHDGTADIKIYNHLGQLVHNSAIAASVVVDLEGWSPGIYIIRAAVDERLISKKLIVQ